MPEVSGSDALRQIRAHPAIAGVPVIMLTAWSSSEAREEVEAMGGVWLEKPVGAESLLQAVRRMRDEPALRPEVA